MMTYFCHQWHNFKLILFPFMTLDAGFESYQCLNVYSYADKKGLTAMKCWNAEFDRCCTRVKPRESIACKWENMQARDPPWLWNLEQRSPEVQNRDTSEPIKRVMFSKNNALFVLTYVVLAQCEQSVKFSRSTTFNYSRMETVNLPSRPHLIDSKRRINNLSLCTFAESLPGWKI